jgi:mannan endo-1,4-beta-mannosidase
MKHTHRVLVIAVMGTILIGCSSPANIASEEGNDDTGTAHTSPATVIEKSTNANLSALTVDSGTLSPDFAVATTTYSVSVPYAVVSVTISGTPADTHAVVSGSVTLSDLVTGVPQIATITVTAESGATKVYTVEVTRTVVPPADVDARRAEILAYITDLSTGPYVGTISGQNCYHGTEIIAGYTNLVDKLHTATGKWVGILGVDYEFQKIFTPAELSRTNQVLIDYAQAGGLVAVTLTPQNPWENDESDLISNPGSWDGPAGTQNKNGFAKVTSLNDLIDPAKPVNVAWMRKLDRVAAALQELRDAGVIVLFRPMQEMNGNWFWWGMQSHPNDPSPYVNVFRQMHDYFTHDKQLNNLIWVYSPNSSFGESNSSTWNRTVNWAYPGDDYVDIIAGTNYADNMILPDYSVYVSMKKPLGIAEFGPTIGGPAATNGTWDTSQIIVKIKNNYPRIAFWVSWHSYPQQDWSLISNQNYIALMNDPSVINRDDFTWSWLP